MTRKERDRLYYLANKDKYSNPEALKRKRDWRRTHIPNTLVNSARKRAKIKGIPFDITKEDIIIPEFCPILSIPLTPNQDGSHKYSKNSPTIDRIVPELGYIKGNVQVVSHLANVMKNCANVEELKRFASWVVVTYE